MSLTRGLIASFLLLLGKNKPSVLTRSSSSSSSTRSSLRSSSIMVEGTAPATTATTTATTFSLPASEGSMQQSSSSQDDDPLHLIVLVHGWLGNPEELSVLREFLLEQSNGNTSASTSTSSLLVHSATCNHGRTHDGIAAGGRRLAEEINSWVAALSSHHQQQQQQRRMTLSLVGNSLGGLYARYALSEIRWNNHNNNTNNNNTHHELANGSLLQPAVFVTTATPHLGVAGPHHAYVRTPRWFERAVVAPVLRHTGRDLFRVTNVLEQMAVQPHFVQPLQGFRRRYALANAHNTDFQVPCATAAFLAHNSNTNNNNTAAAATAAASSSPSSWHYRITKASATGSTAMTATSLPHAILAVETRAVVLELEHETMGSSTNVVDETAAATTAATTPLPPPQPLSSNELAVRLDALGWTKIFMDVRSHLPSMNLVAKFSRGVSTNNNDNNNSSNNSSNSNSCGGLDANQNEFTSQQLWEALAADFVPRDGDLRVPLGHQVLVANAKNERYAAWTRSGRVVMEALAQLIIQEIVATTFTATVDLGVERAASESLERNENDSGNQETR